MKKIDKKDRLKGILGTLLFHGILLSVFIFFGFQNPGQIAEGGGGGGGGMDVRLGDLEDNGQMDITPPTAYVSSTPVTDETKNDEEILTQNNDETSSINQVEKIKNIKNPNPVNVKTETTVKTETAKAEQTVDPNLLFNPKKIGQKGNPNGNPNSKNPDGGTGKGTGSGNGNGNGSGNGNGNGSGNGNGNGNGNGDGIGDGNGPGISYSLGNRQSKNIPKPLYNTGEQGKVVVAITVDRDGKVIKAIAGAQGSTTTDANLKKLATNAALKATFVANPKAPEEQFGTITYKFIKLNE